MGGGRINLVLADDNSLFCRELQESLLEFPNIHIKARAADGQETLQRLVEVQPDILVLDMFLPRMDGVGVLRSLRDMQTLREIRVLAMCGVGQDHIENLAFSFGADYVLVKPFPAALFAQRVGDLAEGRFPAGARVRDLAIYSLLAQLCVPTGILGYRYLCEAIRLSAIDEQMLLNITGRLYPKLAAIFRSTSSRVERSIRHAIELAMQSAQPKDIEEVLGASFLPPRDRPTNGRFIALLAEKARMRHIEMGMTMKPKEEE